MSVSGKEIADAGDNVARNSDSEDDGFGNQRRKKRRGYHGFVGKFRRVLLCSSFPKSRNRRPISARGDDKGAVAYNNQRCFLCVSGPGNLESPAESLSSDPNHPTFTHEMLRALLEKNEFYSKECNTHLHVDDLTLWDNM